LPALKSRRVTVPSASAAAAVIWIVAGAENTAPFTGLVIDVVGFTFAGAGALGAVGSLVGVVVPPLFGTILVSLMGVPGGESK
jgi:hypothetical protein